MFPLCSETINFSAVKLPVNLVSFIISFEANFNRLNSESSLAPRPDQRKLGGKIVSVGLDVVEFNCGFFFLLFKKI